MNNKPRAFRVKITRTCNSPSQDHGTWCHKSLRSVPSDPEEMVYYHFAEERTHEQCTCQKFCREVVPRFFAWEHLRKRNSRCYSAKEMCIWGLINIRYLHADMWHSFVVFVQFWGDSFNPERLKVNFEISLLPVILMHSSKISEGKVFLSAYLPWVTGNHALRLLKIVLADGWIVYRMRWFLELTIGSKPTRRQIVCTMYDVANRRKLMLIWIRAVGDMLKGGCPPVIIPRSPWRIPEESIVESSYNGLLGERSYRSSGGDRGGVEMWQFL